MFILSKLILNPKVILGFSVLFFIGGAFILGQNLERKSNYIEELESFQGTTEKINEAIRDTFDADTARQRLRERQKNK